MSTGMCECSYSNPNHSFAHEFRFDSSTYGSNPDSVARNELCRLSTASSEVSFGCLQRHSSTSSNASVSTAASSTPSVKDSPRPKHRKTFSNSSITRRLLQKSRPQEAPRKNETALTSSPVTASAPPVPTPAPATNLSPPPAAEGKISDLVVRCRSDVYHVDRVIMCYHSRWFARVCAVVMSPVCSSHSHSDFADKSRNRRRAQLILVRTIPQLLQQ